MHRSMLAGLLAIAALALAGCSGTGNFDVQQTEPFRVSLEGQPQTVVVSDTDSEAKQVEVVTCADPCANDDPCDDDCPDKQVTVTVNVSPQTSDACVVKVIVKDKVTGEILDEREVDAGGSSQSTVTETETQTVTQTQTASSGGAVMQQFVVNVKGNHNLVVLTQAIQGSASVDVSAAHASGQGSIDSTETDSEPSTTTTMTSSSASNTTTNGTSPP